MFTGLIEQVGTIRRLERNGTSYLLTIAHLPWDEPLKVGDSVAVNGICLTTVDVQAQAFGATAMPETVQHSAMAKWELGMHVNLERALSVNGRLHGHFVSGHIDGIGQISQIRRAEVAHRIRVQVEPALLRYIIPKGSIALDGMSLTITKTGENYFEVSIIPHTWQQTNTREYQNGSVVNIETDVLGKYIDHLLGSQKNTDENLQKILIQNGFLD